MVKEWKVSFVDEIANRMTKAKVLGLADFGRLPSKQVQIIRQALRGKGEIKCVKRALVEKALEKTKIPLSDNLPDSVAVITSDLNAFELFRIIKSKRSKASAKPGMICEKDIVIPKGGTGLPPGQAIADLQNAGIPSKIAKGQIEVIKDHLLLKTGEVVTPQIAIALNALDIKPFEFGLEISAILEDGVVFTKDVLDVDIDAIRGQFSTAGAEAFNLAIETVYPTKEVVEILLSRLAGQAKSLALKMDWISKDTVNQVLGKANAHAICLDKKIPWNGDKIGGS
ncbi:MAG: 50S ribosomal protein L10 [Candidatus Altiarchaeota archaeon]|nr:50S ribosomal protein L10 [Candidatus Altiarchaeota archaeon]